MFGYIEPLKPELKIKDYACFRSYYCGVCKALGKRYNSFSRFTVTYDAAFLALLNSSIGEYDETICFEKCIVNPLQIQAGSKRQLGGGLCCHDKCSNGVL